MGRRKLMCSPVPPRPAVGDKGSVVSTASLSFESRLRSEDKDIIRMFERDARLPKSFEDRRFHAFSKQLPSWSREMFREFMDNINRLEEEKAAMKALNQSHLRVTEWDDMPSVYFPESSSRQFDYELPSHEAITAQATSPLPDPGTTILPGPEAFFAQIAFSKSGFTVPEVVGRRWADVAKEFTEALESQRQEDKVHEELCINRRQQSRHKRKIRKVQAASVAELALQKMISDDAERRRTRTKTRNTPTKFYYLNDRGQATYVQGGVLV